MHASRRMPKCNTLAGTPHRRPSGASHRRPPDTHPRVASRQAAPQPAHTLRAVLQRSLPPPPPHTRRLRTSSGTRRYLIVLPLTYTSGRRQNLSPSCRMSDAREGLVCDGSTTPPHRPHSPHEHGTPTSRVTGARARCTRHDTCKALAGAPTRERRGALNTRPSARRQPRLLPRTLAPGAPPPLPDLGCADDLAEVDVHPRIAQHQVSIVGLAALQLDQLRGGNRGVVLRSGRYPGQTANCDRALRRPHAQTQARESQADLAYHWMPLGGLQKGKRQHAASAFGASLSSSDDHQLNSMAGLTAIQ